MSHILIAEDEKFLSLTMKDNLEADISKSLEFMDGFHEYLVKSDWKIEDVIKRVREKLEK